MQIEDTINHNFTPVKMDIIKTTKFTSVGKDMEERDPLDTWGRNVN
jgi:hypothetical protein